MAILFQDDVNVNLLPCRVSFMVEEAKGNGGGGAETDYNCVADHNDTLSLSTGFYYRIGNNKCTMHAMYRTSYSGIVLAQP